MSSVTPLRPLNVRLSTPGRGRPVCEFCGASTRADVPLHDGQRISLWEMFDLPRGWSTSPFPAGHVHGDGSVGSTYCCPRCNRQRGGLAVKLDRR